MDCTKLLLNLEVGHPNAGLLAAAGDLVSRFGAGIIGVAACQPLQILYNDAYGWTDLAEQDRREIKRGTDAVEAAFRAAMADHTADLDFRSAVIFAPLCEFIAEQARGADLIIARSNCRSAPDNPTRRADIGTLVMQAGRPILLVPEAIHRVALSHVLVAWKDSREARRAVADALPLMRRADRVTILEIADDTGVPAALERVADVVRWCQGHGVTAEPLALTDGGNDAARLDQVARESKVDLIVAGAYGHSRLREWAFGGVTSGLLTRTESCVMLSH